MPVDVLSTVTATAATLCSVNENDDYDLAKCARVDESSDAPATEPIAANQYPGETIAELREARDLNRARVRRLIVMLRRLQAIPDQGADGGEAMDQRMSQLLERAVTQAAGAKTQSVDTERAQLAAMRELSQLNAKRLLNTHFRRNLWRVTASHGMITLLALVAGAGLLTVSRAAWPAAAYAAILCFALAGVWGYRYLMAVFAPLRRRSLLDTDWRTTTTTAQPALTSEIDPLTPNAGSIGPPDKCTVADLLAELHTATGTPGS